MSTINKSGKRFVPKVGARRGVNHAPPTPQASQVSQQTEHENEHENENENENENEDGSLRSPSPNTVGDITPVSTQSHVFVPPVRKASFSTHYGHESVQNSSGGSGGSVSGNSQPRMRLNSLTTPSVRRGSVGVGINETSGLGGLGGLGVPMPVSVSVSRRGSVLGGITSTASSRRGSMREDSGSGSVSFSGVGVGGGVGGSGSGSVSGVSGGISIGIPVHRGKKRRASRISVDHERVVEEEVADVEREAEAEAGVTATPVERATSPAPVVAAAPVVAKIEVTETDRRLGKKKLYNTARSRYEDVAIDDIPDKTAEISDNSDNSNRYTVNTAVRHVSELGVLRRAGEDYRLNEDLHFDAQHVTMDQLCRPFLPLGKVSRNYAQAVDGHRRLAEARVHRKRVRDLARALRVPEERARAVLAEKQGAGGGDADTDTPNPGSIDLMDISGAGADDAEKSSASVPLLQIDAATGKVTYSAESTQVDRRRAGDGANGNGSHPERIEENPFFEGVVTSATYAPRPVTSRWTPQEVASLLHGVRVFGTDFALIAQMFPHRTRRQIKARFLLEERVRPHVVELALSRRSSTDVETYAGLSGTPVAGHVADFQAELQALRTQHAEEARELERAKIAAAREDAHLNTPGGNNSGSGSGGKKSRRAVIAEFRKNEEVVGVL